jgi:hypothetical protein
LQPRFGPSAQERSSIKTIGCKQNKTRSNRQIGDKIRLPPHMPDPHDESDRYNTIIIKRAMSE